MKYIEQVPGISPQLKARPGQQHPVILNYWLFDIGQIANPPFIHDTLPERTISIVLIYHPHYQTIRLLGPHTKKFSRPIQSNTIFLGIRLQAWITFDWLIENKLAIVNQTSEAPPEITSSFQQTMQQLSKPDHSIFKILEIETLRFLSQHQIKTNNVVKYICSQLEIGKSIASIVDEIPASIRVIQKKFKSITGLTMKQYASIVRQRNTWKSMIEEEQHPLSAILNNGYYDQAHFINEFKKTMDRQHSGFYDYLKSMEIKID